MKKDKDKDASQAEEEVRLNESNTKPEAETEQEPADVVVEEVEVESPKTDPVAAELAEMKDKYLRLYSEFDNFRRRTAKERLELQKTATQDLMVALLPVLDDLERAKQAMETTTDVEVVKEGLELVFHKLLNTLSGKGLVAIDAIGEEFDVEKHEAITQIPAPSDDMKGKVVDQVEKGYNLHDKVIRFAKVVIGA